MWCVFLPGGDVLFLGATGRAHKVDVRAGEGLRVICNFFKKEIFRKNYG